ADARFDLALFLAGAFDFALVSVEHRKRGAEEEAQRVAVPVEKLPVINAADGVVDLPLSELAANVGLIADLVLSQRLEIGPQVEGLRGDRVEHHGTRVAP